MNGSFVAETKLVICNSDVNSLTDTKNNEELKISSKAPIPKDGYKNIYNSSIINNFEQEMLKECQRN